MRVERKTDIKSRVNALSEFATVLGGWDNRIREILWITSPDHDQTQRRRRATLVCRYEPPDSQDLNLQFSTINLLLQGEIEGVSQRLGIESQVDIGYLLNGEIFLPDGRILKYQGQETVLWSTHDDKF